MVCNVVLYNTSRLAQEENLSEDSNYGMGRVFCIDCKETDFAPNVLFDLGALQGIAHRHG